MVYRVQIHNQSLELLLTEASYTLHFREKPWTELSASFTGLLPFESTLIREFLVSSYDQRTYP